MKKIIAALAILVSVLGFTDYTNTVSAAPNICSTWYGSTTGYAYCGAGDSTYFAVRVACKQNGGTYTYWETSPWKRAGSGQQASVKCYPGFHPVGATKQLSSY